MWHPQTPGKSASLQQIGRSLLARLDEAAGAADAAREVNRAVVA